MVTASGSYGAGIGGGSISGDGGDSVVITISGGYITISGGSGTIVITGGVPAGTVLGDRNNSYPNQTGIDTESLCFYSYEKEANTYKRIDKPAYWIDKNGYLHFKAECTGCWEKQEKNKNEIDSQWTGNV